MPPISTPTSLDESYDFLQQPDFSLLDYGWPLANYGIADLSFDSLPGPDINSRPAYDVLTTATLSQSELEDYDTSDLLNIQAPKHIQSDLGPSSARTSQAVPSGGAGPSSKNHRCQRPGCSKAFASSRQLANHVRRHTLPRLCPHFPACPDTFADRKDTLRHLSRTHPTRDAENTCPAPGCYKTFPGRKDALLRHVKAVRHVARYGRIVLDAPPDDVSDEV